MIYHVLNGDALKQKFPSTLKGKCIIARECLVDGPVQGKTIEEFYLTRAFYLNTTYGSLSDTKYEEEVIPELDKLKHIESNAQVYVWFEDDLFCQVNLWFIIHQLHHHNPSLRVQLIRPFTNSEYGFGVMHTQDLEKAFKTKIDLSIYPEMVKLWTAYQDNNIHLLTQIGDIYKESLPFLRLSIKAHLDRNLHKPEPGRPEKTLKRIIEELDYPGFGPVFQAFCKEESIYGFGDLQVKRLYNNLIR